MSTVLHLDTETFSDTPIKHGTHRYAEHVEVMLVAWAIDEEASAVWDRTADEPMPARLEHALADPAVQVTMHNSHFDRTVMRHGMGIAIPPERIHDTMVQALAHGLPGSLDDLCTILRVPVDKAKDKAGKRLIQLFCKPQPATYKVRRATRLTHPEQWAAFKEYARLDIDAMREVRKRLPMVNFTPTERAMWVLDQRINDRGVAVDMELVHAAISAVDEEQKRLAVRTAEMTDGVVASTTQRDALLRYILEEHGVVMDNLRGATVTRMLEDESLSPELRALLRVREQASTTSTSKYKALLRGTSSDGRLRGTLQYAGAMRTLRWAGRLFQPQNITRGTIHGPLLTAGIEALKLGCAPLLFPDVMELLSSAIRGALIAPKGRKMVVSDLSNIEGRVQAWLAGEDWKLQAFRDFDTIIGIDDKGEPIRKGHDLYKLAYAKSFGVDPASVDKEQRQVGKVQELALGFAGAVGAFVTFAAAYSIDLEELPNKVLPHAPESVVAEADSFYTWVLKQKMPTFGLSPDAYIACDVLKRGWRYGHPAIASYWPELEDAAIRALLHRGERFRARKVAFVASKNWLFMELPSGRSICYPAARILNGAVTYMGINQYTRKWERIKTTGGKLFENCIAEGTKVLTPHGWCPIEKTGSGERVWDGEAWVSFAAVTCKGRQRVIEAHGVWMTANHLVLTEKGWVDAIESTRYNRASCRLPDSVVPKRVKWAAHFMGLTLRLRGAQAPVRSRILKDGTARGNSVLWVQTESDNREQDATPRYVVPSRLRGVPINDRSVRATHTPGIPQLWRAWYFCLRSVASVFQKFLARYGADVLRGGHFGTRGQSTRVSPLKLRLAILQGAGEQQKNQQKDSDTTRGNDAFCCSANIPNKAQHLELADRQRLADRTRSWAMVYDLVDCGPRHRFVVQDKDGNALIVHNCCQALARDVMAHNMPAIDERGYEIVLSVHDELITETPDSDEFTADELSRMLAANPPWAPDMPLAAAGFETYTYRKD